eukprot:RCo041391
MLGRKLSVPSQKASSEPSCSALGVCSPVVVQSAEGITPGGCCELGPAAVPVATPSFVLNRWWVSAVLVAVGSVGPSVLGLLVSQYVPVILQDGNSDFQSAGKCSNSVSKLQVAHSFGLRPIAAYAVLASNNLLSSVLSTLIGHRSERFRVRGVGGLKVFIFFGAVIAVASFVLIPVVPTLWALILCVMVRQLSTAFWSVPVGAWLGKLFPSEYRSKADGVVLITAGITAGAAVSASGAIAGNVGLWVAFLLFGGTVFVLVLPPLLLLPDSTPMKGATGAEPVPAPTAPAEKGR